MSFERRSDSYTLSNLSPYSATSTFINSPSSASLSPRSTRHRRDDVRLSPALSERDDEDATLSDRTDGDAYFDAFRGLGIESANHPHIEKPASYRSFSPSSRHSSYQQTYPIEESTEGLIKKQMRPRQLNLPPSPPFPCPSHRTIWVPRKNFLSITLLVVSIFSTTFSGMYLVIALRGPRYGRIIDRSISYSTVSTLIALFAKLIEMTFVTVFVAFIGQVLSRRAFMRKQGRGITLAEMSMRSWIMQPGTILTHVESVRYAFFTILGVLSMVAALTAMLYTTAADALVIPQLKFGQVEYRSMQGLVKSSYANPDYVKVNCETPIRDDPLYGGQTCLQIEHAAQGYHNYARYLSQWNVVADNNNGTANMQGRPKGYGLLYENTTITAPWVDIVDMAAVSRAAGRVINNVSLAMPHSGIVQAAGDPMNGILQPEGDQGVNVYEITASVPSPVVNVLCVNISKEELAPLVYEAWPNANISDLSSYEDYVPEWTEDEWLNKTAVDDIFGFGPAWGQRRPPVFPKYPLPYNTLLNASGVYEGRDAIYLLAQGGPEVNHDFALCSLKSSMTPFCSTSYNATSTGGTMEARCDDPSDPMQYIRSVPAALSGNATISLDWVNMASIWGFALSLNDGAYDGNASNARLLTQLIPQSAHLNEALPSIAEALAVMAGCTLIMASQDAPFVEFWNYTTNPLTVGQHQSFIASVRTQQYASGGGSGYQRGFYIILFSVFAGNILVLAWFLTHEGVVTDFSDPPNLFSLTINSPPSQGFAGSCGGGPDGKQYKVQWFVNVDDEHIYLENREQRMATDRRAMLASGMAAEEPTTPIARMHSRLSSHRSLL